MRNIILTIVTFIMILTITLPVNAAPKRIAKYRTEIAVVTCDGYGRKTLDVFYPNGQIHIFQSSLVKRYKVGQIVKVKFATNRTKSIKDDKIMRIRKANTNDQSIKNYAEDYAWFYHRITWKAQ